MKKFFGNLILTTLALTLMGCGFSDKGNAGKGQGASYEQAVDILNLIWENTPEEEKFPSYGGNSSDPVMDAPGTVDRGDTNLLSYTLLVPEDLQESVTDERQHFYGSGTENTGDGGGKSGGERERHRCRKSVCLRFSGEAYGNHRRGLYTICFWFRGECDKFPVNRRIKSRRGKSDL